ncbi:MAG: hypothetical protein AAB336_13660 [Acidobacteriota bacterium]
MNKYNSWVGLGFKGGGFTAIAGFDYVSGTLRNVGLMSEHHDFHILNVRGGIGLGGSVGAIFCAVYNCPNLWRLHDTWVSDWSINVALGGRWDSVAKGLKNYNLIATVKKINDSKKLNPADLENIRNGASYIWGAVDTIRMNDSPKLITIDIPMAGVGYELSAFVSAGKIEMLN